MFTLKDSLYSALTGDTDDVEPPGNRKGDLPLFSLQVSQRIHFPNIRHYITDLLSTLRAPNALKTAVRCLV